jgi:multicomponent Na+:H+ antiporter subunit E
LPKTKFPAVLSTFLLCFCFWILLTWSFTTQELAAGAVVSLAAALFASKFFIHENAFWLFNPAKLGALIAYVFTFLGELVKANLDVARRVFGGCKDVNPGIVKVPVDLKGDYAQAMLANSITLTPGTITMEVTEEEGQTYFYIHWIDVSAPSGKEAGDAVKGTLEKGLRRVWQ